MHELVNKREWKKNEGEKQTLDLPAPPQSGNPMLLRLPSYSAYSRGLYSLNKPISPKRERSKLYIISTNYGQSKVHNAGADPGMERSGPPPSFDTQIMQTQPNFGLYQPFGPLFLH